MSSSEGASPSRARRASPSSFARAAMGMAALLSTLVVLCCGAPEECVRGSDCADGWACVSGSCRNASAGGTEADPGEARTKADATAAGDASRAASADAATRPSDASASDGAASPRDADTAD